MWDRVDRRDIPEPSEASTHSTEWQLATHSQARHPHRCTQGYWDLLLLASAEGCCLQEQHMKRKKVNNLEFSMNDITENLQ